MSVQEFGYNIAAGDNGDWAKRSFDFPPDITSAVDFATFLVAQGETVEHFKTLPAYYLALDAGSPAWLKDL